MPLVTLMTFRNPADAELARSVLADEGIHVAADGGRLQVEDADVERAESILNRIAGLDIAEQSSASAEYAIRHPELCPQCGSPDVRHTRRLLSFTIVAALLFSAGVAVQQLIFAFYLTLASCIFFLIASPYRCANCGHRW